MKVSLRFSRQRKAIEDTLCGRRDHPTAEMLYESLRTQIPGISLGTVYRNLTLLEEQGAIQRIPMTGSPDRFDGNACEHNHLQCAECGAVVDMPGEFPVDLALAQQYADLCGAKIQGVQLLFTGLCGGCHEAWIANPDKTPSTN